MILRSDQVSSDCIVVDERTHNDVDVPDGVGQGDDPITLEEYHAKLQISHCLGNFLGTKKNLSIIKSTQKRGSTSHQIDGAACLKLCQSRNITLGRNWGEGFIKILILCFP